LHREPTTHPSDARPPTALPSAASAPASPESRKPAAPGTAHKSRPPLGRQTETAGRHAVHREPATHPGGARPPIALPSAASAPARVVAHQPPAPAAAAAHASRPPLAGHQIETAGRHALHRERRATPPLARLTPTKAAALRSTTLAATWNPGLAAERAQRFGPLLPAPGWRIPQAMPPTDPVAAAVRSFLAKTQCHAT